MEILGGSVRGHFANQGVIARTAGGIFRRGGGLNFFFKNMGGKVWLRNNMSSDRPKIAIRNNVA